MRTPTYYVGAISRHAAFPASFTHVAPLFVTLYTYSWFVGLVIASVIYAGLMWGVRVAEQREAAPALATGDAMR